MDIKEILEKYWADIVAIFDKIYFYIKGLVEAKAE